MIAPAHHESDPSQSRHAWEMEHQSLSERGVFGDPRDGIADRAADTIGRFPVAAIAAAMMLGATAGWLVKRKLFQ